LAQRGLSRIPPGQNIDHIRPLSQGGSDTPSNMRLLSVEAHHQKTAAERRQY
jgi:5-methylcytosine-specific restriction endonuclease McrA